MANSAKVADMHEARARRPSDVIRETKVLVKNRLRTGQVGVNVWVEAESRLREWTGLEFS